MKRFMIAFAIIFTTLMVLHKKFNVFQPLMRYSVTELVVKPDAKFLAQLDSGQTVQLCPMLRLRHNNKLVLAVPYDTIEACKIEYLSLPDSEQIEVKRADQFPSIDIGPIEWQLIPDSLGNDMPRATASGDVET